MIHLINYLSTLWCRNQLNQPYSYVARRPAIADQCPQRLQTNPSLQFQRIWTIRAHTVLASCARYETVLCNRGCWIQTSEESCLQLSFSSFHLQVQQKTGGVGRQCVQKSSFHLSECLLFRHWERQVTHLVHMVKKWGGVSAFSALT